MEFITNWIQQIKSAIIQYRRISIWLFTIITVLSFVDVIDNVPVLQSLVTSHLYTFFSNIDDLIAIGLILFVAYRWHPALGQGAIIFYLVLHVSHFFLGFMPSPDVPIRLGSIGFISIIGIWAMSRLRRLETELRTSEEMFRTMSDSSPIGIYIVQNGKFRYVNPQFQKCTGYSEGELIGIDSLTLVIAEDRNTVRRNAVMMLKGMSTSPYEYTILTKSGAIKWILETVVSIRYQGRQATLGNFIDITERKKIGLI